MAGKGDTERSKVGENIRSSHKQPTGGHHQRVTNGTTGYGGRAGDEIH